MLHGVIMAGGSGTRFWPQSRRALPKQFLTLDGTRSMIQATRDRCSPWISDERMWVVTGAKHAAETRRQLPELPAAQILCEPCGRNTAACVGLAAIQLIARDPDAIMLVLPADHVIRPPEKFHAAVDAALNLLDQDPRQFVLFGVKPTYPATGYGYIERVDNSGGVDVGHNAGRDSEPDVQRDVRVYDVNCFREKPVRGVAEEYVRAGRFYWNCGIFVWRADRILEALAQYEPELHAGLMSLAREVGGPNWDAALEQEFPRLKSIAIDCAVLERASGIRVIEAPFEWDDVGSWLAVMRLAGADADGNTIDGPHVGVRSRDCIVRTTSDHVVATLGVENLIIVHTPDATLVARKDDEDSVRQLVDALAARGLDRFL